MLESIMNFLKTNVGILDIIDIGIISFVIYRILLLLRGTRAFYMLITIIILIVFFGISDFLGLKTISWVLSNMTGYFFVALVVIFQPEFRRALASFGESKFFEKSTPLNTVMVDELSKGSVNLANRKIGALIVFQRNTNISHYIENLGVKIDSLLTKDLLLSIFIPYSPLHDGAIIVNGSRIEYAGAILPLTKREDISSQYGTRHRAAIGITEETDAVVVVISEERGEISLVVGGNIYPNLDGPSLKEHLSDIFKIQ